MGFWVGFPDLEIRREARSRGAGAGGVGVAGLPKNFVWSKMRGASPGSATGLINQNGGAYIREGGGL